MTTTETLRGSVVRGTAWSAVGRFGGLAFGAAAQAGIARLLRPDDFGSFALVTSSAAAVALFAQAALPQTVVRSVAAARADPAGNRARAALVEALRLTAVVAVIAALLVVLPTGQLVDVAFPQLHVRTITAIFAALVVGRLLANVLPELFRGLREFREASLLGSLIEPAALALATGALLIALGDASLETALLAAAGASALTLAAAALRLWVLARRLPPSKSPGPALNLRLISPALWLSNSLTFVITQSDLWVVGALGNRRDVSVYSAAFRLSTLVIAPAAIVTFVVSPFIVELLSTGQHQRLQRLLRTVATVAGIPSVLVLLVMAGAGGTIAGLFFGRFYERSGTVLALLTVGKIATVLTGACGVALIMAGRQRDHLAAVATSLVLTLPAQVLGHELFGLAGLAVATSAGLVTQNVLLLLLARHRLGIWTHVSLREGSQVWRDARATRSWRRALGLGDGQGRGPD